MKITPKPTRRGKDGYALLITLMFLGIAVLALIDMWRWTANNTALSQRNNTFNQSTDAAEAATEQVFTLMDQDFLYGNLNSSAYYCTNIPNTSSWPVQYIFSDGNGNTNRIYVGMSSTNHYEPLNSQYAGLNSLAYDCTNIAIATPKGQRYNVAATIQQTFQAGIIPIFQFAIFYNLNLEICPGSPMTITGPVFCNQGIWEGSQSTTFNSTVTAVTTNNTTALDPFCAGYQPQGGNPTFVLSTEPSIGHALTLPIGSSTNSNPTNVESILNLPPASLSVPADIGYLDTNLIYLYNASDLIISNASAGTASATPSGNNIIIYYNDKQQSPRMRQLTNDFYVLQQPVGTIHTTNYVWPGVAPYTTLYTNRCATNVSYYGWSFVTNVSFYDYRESATVQAVQIDISMFDNWVTNQIATNGGGKYNIQCGGTDGSTGDKYHPIDSIYIYNNVSFSGTQLPAVRLINGQVLPSKWGLTVSTPQPGYIYGNYNVRTNATLGGTDIGFNATTNSYPASIMADAITILSTNWNDAYGTANEDPTGSTHGPGDTTVNAAMLEGIVQSYNDSSGNGHYSGGVENFLRLLEDWGNTGSSGHRPILTYNGSIVVMFPSIYATNPWGGAYYGVPQRQWAFDLNFTNQAGLPPLAPSSRALVRGNWSAY
jgi:hypothetical protein